MIVLLYFGYEEENEHKIYLFGGHLMRVLSGKKDLYLLIWSRFICWRMILYFGVSYVASMHQFCHYAP